MYAALPSWAGRMVLLLLCGITLPSWAQTTRISGRVYDAASGEPLPFVNIAFLNSRIGTTSDMNGNYLLETFYATDSLRATFVGYVPMTVKVKRDQSQRIDFALRESKVDLEEMVVRAPTENPAFTILRRVIAHKPVNNREKLSAYEFAAYNKVEFDLNNITEEFTQKKLFKHFAFIFDNIDSSDAKPYLPIFMTETLSEVYYRQKPRTRREVIRGTKVSGIENESVSQFMGDMYQNVNIYENFLLIFGKNFVSPIADGGRGFYDYYLTDSAWVGRNWCYRLEFKPKRVQELAFQGTLWIADTSYAVRIIEAGIAEGANLNYVQAFRVRQEYEEVAHEVWMLTRDELVVDLNVIRDTGKPNKNVVQGFYGRRTATYKDFVIGQLRDDAYYAGVDEVVIARDPDSESSTYWEENRHVPLTEKETAIYHMVDTMKTIPQFRTYVDIVSTIVTGYYPKGMVEIGPYFTTLSFNQVEGARLRLGGRTSNAFSKNVEFEGYMAYGLRDDEVKYGLGGRAFITKEPRQLVGLYFKRDIEQLGQSQNAFREDNLLSSVFRRNPANRLTMTEEVRTYYEREWFTGFSNMLLFRHRIMAPRGILVYERPVEGGEPENVASITTSEVALNTRFAYKEKFVSGEFNRVSLGTLWPVLDVHLALGIPDLFSSDYGYQKLVMRVQQRIPLGALGYFQYSVAGGKMWGTVPYPLLFIHSGNETFYYDEQAFNMMNYFEFLSDRFAHLMMDWHLDGQLFNRIPLFRRLRWREVLTFKAVAGTLDRARHEQEMLFLPNMYDLSGGPYMETSAGIENIFRILRVDALWRLAYRDHPNVPLWTIRMKLYINF